MATISINKTLLNAPAADVVLTTAMSGTTFICIPGAAARTVTLPAPSNPGLRYSFIHSTTVAFAINIAHVGAGQLRGYYNNDGTYTATGANTVSFTATAVPGDTIDMLSDGTHWYAAANSTAAAGLATA